LEKALFIVRILYSTYISRVDRMRVVLLLKQMMPIATTLI